MPRFFAHIKTPRFRLHDLLLIASLGLWLISVQRVDPDAMNDWGLLPALPITFFVAVSLLVVSAAWLLCSKRLGLVRLALHLVVLVLILHGSVPMIFDTPNYPWVYKHIGVVSFISAHGGVDTSIDIYHNWPGFFALAAWFGELAGVESAISYAAWAPVYFNLLILLQLAYILRAFPISLRTRWLALFLFAAANWVGQDYFAPQAMGFVLALGVFAMTLAWLRSERSIWLVRWLQRLTGRIFEARPEGPAAPAPIVPTDLRIARLCALFGVFAFLVVTHQLTPFAVVIGIGLISAAGFVRPRWVVIWMASMAVAYLLLHLPFVERSHDVFGSIFNILHLFDNVNARVASNAEVGRKITALGAQALTLGVWSLAGFGILRRYRAGRPVLAMALLAASPGLIAIAQSYGGEAVFRIYLYSLPWTALLAACAFDTHGWLRIRLRTVGVFGLVAVTSTLFMVAFFGAEELHRVRPGEVAASKYFYDHAQPGSVLVLAAPQFPGRVTADYASYISGDQPNLIGQGPAFRGRLFGPNGVSELTGFADEYATGRGDVYFVVTAGQQVYAQVLGFAPKGALPRLESRVMASTEWRSVCRNTDATLFVRTSQAGSGAGDCRDTRSTPPPSLPSPRDVAGLAIAVPVLAWTLARKRPIAAAVEPLSVPVVEPTSELERLAAGLPVAVWSFVRKRRSEGAAIGSGLATAAMVLAWSGYARKHRTGGARVEEPVEEPRVKTPHRVPRRRPHPLGVRPALLSLLIGVVVGVTAFGTKTTFFTDTPERPAAVAVRKVVVSPAKPEPRPSPVEPGLVEPAASPRRAVSTTRLVRRVQPAPPVMTVVVHGVSEAGGQADGKNRTRAKAEQRRGRR